MQAQDKKGMVSSNIRIGANSVTVDLAFRIEKRNYNYYRGECRFYQSLCPLPIVGHSDGLPAGSGK
jgi:hypothetical protein